MPPTTHVPSGPAVFAAVGFTLLIAHEFADHWLQTTGQARNKYLTGRPGHRACAAHVGSYTATAAVFLTAVAAATGLHLSPLRTAGGLALSAASHYWADRRAPLAALADATGLGGFYRLGAPRHGHDDNPTLGTGAYALDQSFHKVFLFLAALVVGA